MNEFYYMLSNPEVFMGDLIYNHYWLFPVLGIWALIWKGLALWRAAKTGSKSWFILLLVINTFGILEIIYLLATQKKFTSNQEVL